MDRLALFRAMDRAIWRVASTRYFELQEEYPASVRPSEIYAALESLGGLQSGNPPDYGNPWVALFYLTWYQPGQIQLAYQLIERMNRRRPFGNLIPKECRSLHVVDFGCGALAMQFAVAWAAVEAVEVGSNIDHIQIESYDPASAMVELGAKLWEQFTAYAGKDPRLRHLSAIFDLMDTQQYVDLEWLFPFDDPQLPEERWLSAIHTVYQNNIASVSESLSQITNALVPSIGFTSCNSNQQSISRLNEAQLNPRDFRSSKMYMSPRGNEILPNVTQWRKSLFQRLEKQGRSHPFLNSDVTWGFPNAFGVIYTQMA